MKDGGFVVLSVEQKLWMKLSYDKISVQKVTCSYGTLIKHGLQTAMNRSTMMMVMMGILLLM